MAASRSVFYLTVNERERNVVQERLRVIEITTATSYAIQLARRRGRSEVGPEELLLGCLQSLSRFGIVRFGPWTIDLEPLGVDWLQSPARGAGPKVAYSADAVTVFDLAARIARADHATDIRLEHLLAAFTAHDCPLMMELRQDYGIDSAAWRAAAASVQPPVPAGEPAVETNDFLTPEQAAEALGIHVQTLRAYIRSGKLPAARIAGERSLRIRRHDLNKVLEPLVPDMP